jgi:NAD dependent epimerase/dehydratase family enzyme
VAIVEMGLCSPIVEGALPKMAMPLKFGLSGAIGSAIQWVPWIRLEDLCGYSFTFG